MAQIRAVPRGSPASGLWPDVRRVITLAVPVAITELGWMSMAVIDTIMVGRRGPAAICTIGVGNSAFYSVAIFGIGLLLCDRTAENTFKLRKAIGNEESQNGTKLKWSPEPRR